MKTYIVKYTNKHKNYWLKGYNLVAMQVVENSAKAIELTKQLPDFGELVSCKLHPKFNTKKIIIEYFIRSEKCCKYIVKGTRVFTEDSKSISFIRRLNKLKNVLSERSTGQSVKELVKENSRHHGLPFSVTYQCKTIYIYS